MIDIDREIRADAGRWRDHELTPPPDLDKAVGFALYHSGRGKQLKRRASVIGSVAATVVSVVTIAGVALVRNSGSTATSATQPAHSPAPAQTSASQHPSGLVNVGAVKWGAPVRSARDQRVIYLKPLDLPSGVCPDQVTAIRTYVTETSRTVRVRLTGYAAQPAKPQYCDLIPNHLRPKVTLREPLNGRALIDASSGMSHAVLDPASAPQFTNTPLGCVVQDPLEWTPVINTTNILCEDDMSNVEAQIWYAPVGAWEHEYGAPNGVHESPATIRGAEAQVWYDSATPTWTLLWTISTGRQIILMVLNTAGKTMNRQQIIALARSIKNPSK